MRASTRRRPVEPKGRRAAAPEPKAGPSGRRPKGVVWTGTLSFGLVNIPVVLHSGEAAKDLHFTMLDKRDLSPIGYRKVNKNTGREVSSKEIVKGYRWSEDEYVTLSDEDFRKASPEKTQRIDIAAFVDGSKIDPAQFDRPYYLEPAAKSEKAYALLREAMRRAKKVGVATIVLRARQYLAAVIVQGPVLTLELLRYADELRDPSDLRLPGEDLKSLKIRDSELEMAQRLVEELAGPWKPEDFKDEYRTELLAFIERKAKAGDTSPAPPEPAHELPASAPGDIMALLKRSLERSPARRERRKH